MSNKIPQKKQSIYWSPRRSEKGAESLSEEIMANFPNLGRG